MEYMTPLRASFVALLFATSSPAAAVGNIQKYGECITMLSALYSLANSMDASRLAMSRYANTSQNVSGDVQRQVMDASRGMMRATEEFLSANISLCDEMKPAPAASAP
ncbi:hypothetical protein DWF04_015815 [Cereibacter sphaeroides f. sp. denitrificans]|nr:hypothetical protein DWF04_16110 [Cereibacter sphaeroides f. sp. denitrificans]